MDGWLQQPLLPEGWWVKAENSPSHRGVTRFKFLTKENRCQEVVVVMVTVVAMMTMVAMMATR